VIEFSDMKKVNCWEFMKCHRGPSTSDPCPVAGETRANTLNSGFNGGRLCWVVVDILGIKDMECSSRHTASSCFACEFRYKVLTEEGLFNVCKATGYYLKSLNVHPIAT